MEEVQMSSSHETESWLDRYWQVLLILFGITFALVLALSSAMA
jgi:hypothetical protein